MKGQPDIWQGRARRLSRRVRRRRKTLRRRLGLGDHFRLSLEDELQPLSLDLSAESSTMLVAFGGGAGKLDIPPFEFFSLSGGLPVKKIFVRDVRQAAYQRGFPGHGDTIEESAESLGELIAAQGIERLVVAGTSSGGYAALAFGTLLGADQVLAFAPQTSYSLRFVREIGDEKIVNWLEKESTRPVRPPWDDLSVAIPPRRVADTVYDIFFDQAYEVDRRHAERLEGIAGVQLHPQDGGEHRVARHMRRSGELQRVLRDALRVEVRQPVA